MAVANKQDQEQVPGGLTIPEATVLLQEYEDITKQARDIEASLGRTPSRRQRSEAHRKLESLKLRLKKIDTQLGTFRMTEGPDAGKTIAEVTAARDGLPRDPR